MGVDDKTQARLEEWLRAHPYGDQDENGIDLGSLRRNLRLTPFERLERHQKALASLREMKRYART
jgi:hypothetical protein